MCLPPVSILLNLQVPPHSPWPPSTSGLVPVSQFLVFSPSCSLGEVRENWKHILRNLLSKLETNLRNHSLKALFSANRRECLLLLSYFYWRRQWHPTPELFCLENPMDGGAWWAAVHGVSKSQTRLSDFTFTFHFHALEKEMATHSSVLAWRVPGTGQPGGLPSMGSHRVGHNWSDVAAAAAISAAWPTSLFFPSLPQHSLFSIVHTETKIICIIILPNLPYSFFHN